MKETPASTPILSKSYRKRFPFRIATTSFILPDRIAPNVRALAPFVDEVEVLLFEKNAPPSSAEIREVAEILAQTSLTANVHLPLDAALAGDDPQWRIADAALVRGQIDQTRPWQPTSYCLHLAPAPADSGKAGLQRWRRRAAESLSLLLSGGPAPEQITVETLDYPFAWVEPLVEALDLSVCVDLGHLYVNGFDPLALFARHGSRITMLHLHGAAGGRDHLALDRMAPEFLAVTEQILSAYTGVVSIEVFSLDALTASLSFLERIAPSAPAEGV